MVDSSVPYGRLTVPTKRDGLERYINFLILAEYGAALFGFTCGLKQMFMTYMVLQAVFLVWFAWMELKLYMRFRPDEFHEAKLRCVGPIRVASLQIPLWLFYYIVFLPNYIHIVSTSYTAGASYASSTNTTRALFKANWEYIPVAGPMIGGLGIPKILTCLLVFSCGFHLLCAFVLSAYFWGEALPERCDSGNLLFLGKAFRSELAASDIQANNQLMRLLICLFIKYPFLWMKTSLLAVQYDHMSRDAFTATLISLVLAWYGILVLISSFVRMAESVIGIWRQFMTVLVPLLMLWIGLTQQAIHLFGVFYCRTSHDLSLFKNGFFKPGC